VATQPLIDFEKLDLSRVVIGPEEIRRYCQQRNRFEMLHGILHFDLTGNLIVGFRDIRADDWWAADHVPGRPIFPGALQIEGAAQLCTFDFMHRREDLAGRFVGFAGLNDTRFRGLVLPGTRLIWAGAVHRIRSSMFTYKTQGFVDRELVFETEIMGVVI
jgi:3-hydroxymyristoyl/3-hydroxydecanoyl-(acyl carrier protein) dehydratase